MLFNSYSFLLLCLPLLLASWRLAATYAPARLGLVLLLFSVVFYGLWGLPFLVLLAVILGMNYMFAQALAPAPAPQEDDPAAACSTGDGPAACPRCHLSRRALLVTALICNLLPLLWFKYSGFFAHNLAALLHVQWQFTPPGLPLGISFYTFIQIAWLVSVYRGQVRPAGLGRHLLFSSCFPYVISGPIVRYEQLGPQLDALHGSTAEGLARGFSLFTLGLVKKALLADTHAHSADADNNPPQKR